MSPDAVITLLVNTKPSHVLLRCKVVVVFIAGEEKHSFAQLNRSARMLGLEGDVRVTSVKGLHQARRENCST